MNHTIHLKKQLRCIYLSNFFSGLRITDAVWVALLAARGFSLWEIGLAESVYHIVSLLCEVPSGMAADLLGRKRALVAGGILAVLSSLLMAFAPGLFLICAAMGLNALSNTMFSGTDAALTYDSLKQAGQEERYLSVAANRSQIGMLASALGSLASTLRRWSWAGPPSGFFCPCCWAVRPAWPVPRSADGYIPTPCGGSTRCVPCWSAAGPFWSARRLHGAAFWA